VKHQTVAQANAFNAALTRIGFNIPMAEAMVNEGFDALEVLTEVEESDIDGMIKNIRETR
jgi:DnaJ-domain-containing protein 1